MPQSSPSCVVPRRCSPACRRRWRPRRRRADDTSAVRERDVTLRDHRRRHAHRTPLRTRSRWASRSAHMYPADASELVPAGRELAAAGYMALAFNFRGYATRRGQADREGADRHRSAAAELQRPSARGTSSSSAQAWAGRPRSSPRENQEPLAVVAVSAPSTIHGSRRAPRRDARPASGPADGVARRRAGVRRRWRSSSARCPTRRTRRSTTATRTAPTFSTTVRSRSMRSSCSSSGTLPRPTVPTASPETMSDETR